MKNFFKITSFKLILTVIILVIIGSGFFLHRKSFVVSEGEVEIKTNLAVEILYQISNIFIFPVREISQPIIKLFIGSPATGTEIPLSNPMSVYSFALSLIFFLLPILIEVYILSCILAFFLAKKKEPNTNNL